MQLILLSNILEHASFPDFLSDVSALYPGAKFLVTGDLLNVFPEPGEDLRNSIFYELYGEMIVPGMDDLVRNGFRNVQNSAFIDPLWQMFAPTGKNFKKTSVIATKRYRYFFDQVGKVFSNRLDEMVFLFIPGNMDYPYLSWQEICSNPFFMQLDNAVLEINGVKIGGIGGIPNNAHPFRKVAEISPYEMHESEYARRLHLLNGVDILLTHLSPEECPLLQDFLKISPLQLLICRAPFNFKRIHDFRGELKMQIEQNKSVIFVRPFDYPVNNYAIINIGPEKLNPPVMTLHQWHA
jgi:Icc-related predicted phosphoesterase